MEVLLEGRCWGSDNGMYVGEIEIDSVPPDNLLCFSEQNRLPQARCLLLPFRGLVAFITDILGERCGVGVRTGLLSQCFSVSLFRAAVGTCVPFVMGMEGRGCWALWGPRQGRRVCLPEALPGPGQGEVVPSPGRDPGYPRASPLAHLAQQPASIPLPGSPTPPACVFGWVFQSYFPLTKL